MSRHCRPIYCPSPGDEDHIRHSNLAACRFYVVGKGHEPAIYTDEFVARAQVTGFSGGQWKREDTWDAAVATWNRLCSRYHEHHEVPPTTPSPPASPPTPSSISSPSPLTRSSSSTLRTSLASSPAARFTAGRAPATLPRAAPTQSGEWRLRQRQREHPPAIAPLRLVIIPLPSPSPSPSPPPSPIPQCLCPLQIESTRRPGSYRVGDTRWGIEGVNMLFEDRHDLVDYISDARLSRAAVMQSRSYRKLKAFVQRTPYIRQAGDPADSN
ncbi:hypothetical protein C8R47DRAFT_1218362 [Mycena vitilis]|nr:hypothetical protein C8R47DRAFT_1218362 [Mycena vitilis]